MTQVAVIGAGAWGTALANLAARNGRRVALWTRDAEHAQAMRAMGENQRRLPGVGLLPGIEPASDMAGLGHARMVLLAVPTQACRTALTSVAPFLRADAAIVVCAKGIEATTGLFPHEIVHHVLPKQPCLILSGPSFARDLALCLPTAVTLASGQRVDTAMAEAVLAAPWFRLYQSDDMCGVALGGAAKNVLAIACGIAAGQQLGASAGAALIARGFAELARLGEHMGAGRETLMGLSGLGDLVLTCNSPQSRNYGYGYALGSRQPSTSAGVVEGAFTAGALTKLAQKLGVDMPIAEAVDAVLSGRSDITEVIAGLLKRPFRPEAE